MHLENALFALLIALPAIIQRNSGMGSLGGVRLVGACAVFGKRYLFMYAVFGGGFGIGMGIYGYARTDGVWGG